MPEDNVFKPDDWGCFSTCMVMVHVITQTLVYLSIKTMFFMFKLFYLAVLPWIVVWAFISFQWFFTSATKQDRHLLVRRFPWCLSPVMPVVNFDGSWWHIKHYFVSLILLQYTLPPATYQDQVFIQDRPYFDVKHSFIFSKLIPT